ncbi:tail fiber domain-containing protein [Escherichia coli]|uniref:phage tailspike protein n=1 Tax=Escherichia coli TaxID=562 RepID=UPI000390B9F0|nr:phage tailspike protein [Escherichia coli]MED9398157.1 phage tailspike protein [Escherichia marmotae]EHK6172991.1 tail fiber domain-containing protein [Escherichia coli]EIR2564603.1 tail fiber domain-containing protein [Escherichia coli]EIY4304189.1 tail fiber domain-containing protein [Escherichia coli]EJG4989965.1 tail fiber domain-containing protein [Escherichia coli]
MTDIIPNIIVSMPNQLFTMSRTFKSVSNGSIYIGKPDTDPTNPDNQVDVYFENENGKYIKVSQPIKISQAGQPVLNGQFGKFATIKNHSMAIFDAYGSQQHYFPNVMKYAPDQLRQELTNFSGENSPGYADPSNTVWGIDAFSSNEYAKNNAFFGVGAGSSIIGNESDEAVGAENTGIGRRAGASLTTGQRNVLLGHEAGALLTTGSYNIFIYAQSSSYANYKTGSYNVVVGYNAGKLLTSGERNVSVGTDAGSQTTTGRDNVAVGQAAMQNNSTGGGNTYIGAFSGAETGTGGNNLAAGRSALFRNVDGSGNVALGREASLGLSSYGESPNNIVAIGYQAAWSQNGLNGVVFCGMQAGYKATKMNDSVLIGRASGFNLTTGSDNVFVGAASGDSETTGTQLVYLGHQAGRFLIDGTPAKEKLNCVALGYRARVGGDHEIQLGNSSQTVYVYGTVQTRSDERDKADKRIIDGELAVSFVRGIIPYFYKWDFRDDYIEEYNVKIGDDSNGNPIFETRIHQHEKDGSRKRKREHAGYLAQQVKELLDRLGIDCGIYQDHLVNNGCDVKTIAYEQVIPFVTKAIDVAFSRIEGLEQRLNKLENL